MSEDFKACQKAANVAVPKNGMIITLKPGVSDAENTYFDVILYHNFERGAQDLSKDDKTVFLIAQGLLDISMNDGNYVMDRGLGVMKNFLKGLGVTTEEYDLEAMQPEGKC